MKRNMTNKAIFPFLCGGGGGVDFSRHRDQRLLPLKDDKEGHGGRRREDRKRDKSKETHKGRGPRKRIIGTKKKRE